MSNRSKFLMEESSYIPNSIPPALVVFSQSGYGEAMQRMQRPFGSQVPDAKDSLSLSTLSPSSFGLRPMDSFAGLPAQLVHLQQNPFLHPALEGRFSFGSSGAFRPIVTSHSNIVSNSSISSSSTSSGDPNSGNSNPNNSQIKNLPSAFTSPNQHQSNTSSSKRELGTVMDCRNQRQDQDKSGNYVNGGSGQRHRSPPSISSPSVKKEERDRDSLDDGMDGSPCSDLTDRSTPEENHLSKRRRQGSQDSLSCPVCKASIRPMDLESHLLAEVEQLMCMTRLRRSQMEPSTSSSGIVDSPSGTGSKNRDSGGCGPETSQDSRWDTYHRVRANRHSRLRGKTKRRREDSGSLHVTCPVCQVPLQGSNEQFSAHVEACLRKNGDMLDEDEPVDIEGDGDPHEMEAYGWLSGHRRSRASPNCAINMTTTSRRRDEENDSLEVVVDGDDTTSYGGAQYTESDILSAQAQDSSGSHHEVKLRPWEDDDGSGNGDEGGSQEGPNSTLILQSLKGRVREIEKSTKGSGTSPTDGNHCLICMEKYKKPVVSISCWHVLCEACWLKTLGTKKLCPQCNTITSAMDLRRIYL